MIRGLQRHPFGVEAFFRRSLVLTYAVPSAAFANAFYLENVPYSWTPGTLQAIA